MKSTLEELEMLRDLFARHGYPRPLEDYRWQYLDIPTKQCFVQFVVDEHAPVHKLAAVVASFALPFKLGAEKSLGVQTNNVLTDRDYRDQGLFYSSVLETFEYFEANELAFGYGFPNQYSAPTYIDHFGWSSLDPLPMLIKPLRANYFIERLGTPAWITRRLPTIPLTRRPQLELGSDYTIGRELCFDESFDALWKAFSKDIPVAVERDHSYLDWRFRQKPAVGYRMISLHKGAEVCAYVIYRLQQKHGGSIGYIMEFVHHPDHAKGGAMILRQAAYELARQECDAILAWSFAHSPNYGAYRTCNFLPFPERLRPVEGHMAANAFEEGNAELVLDRKNWFISYSDLDTV